MLFSISFNQKAIYDYKLANNYDIDDKDAMIIEAVYQFCGSKLAQRSAIKIEDDIFYYISYNLIIEQLPLMKINNKEVIARRLNKLCKYGIFKKFLDKSAGNKTYFTTTEITDTFYKTIEVSTQKSEGCRLKSRKGVDSKVESLSTEKSDNNIHSNNNIPNSIPYNYNSTIEKEIKEKEEFSVNDETLPPLPPRSDGTPRNRATPEQMEQLKQNFKQGKVFVCTAKNIEMDYETEKAYYDSEHYKEWERQYYEDNPDEVETTHLKQQESPAKNTLVLSQKHDNIVENTNEIPGQKYLSEGVRANNAFSAQNNTKSVDITGKKGARNTRLKTKVKAVKVETVLPYPQNWTEPELEAWQRWINKPRKKLKQINSDRAKRHIGILESVKQQGGDIVYAIDVVADTWEGMQEHFFDNYLFSIRRKQPNAHSLPKTYHANQILEMERAGLLDPFAGYKSPENNLDE
jgi:hypothetical protein